MITVDAQRGVVLMPGTFRPRWQSMRRLSGMQLTELFDVPVLPRMSSGS